MKIRTMTKYEIARKFEKVTLAFLKDKITALEANKLYTELEIRKEIIDATQRPSKVS